MTSLSLERRIAADPTSTALLLAGPTAVDLWPGARRDGEVDGRVRVTAALPGLAVLPGGRLDAHPDSQVDRQADSRTAGATEVLVTALPPRRTPVSFVTRFAWAGSVDVPDVDGTLTLRYDGPLATRAQLDLRTDGDLESAGVGGMAGEFLANLAAAAEARATAA